MNTHDTTQKQQGSSSQSQNLSTDRAGFGSAYERGGASSFHDTPSTSTSTVATRSAHFSQESSIRNFHSAESRLDQVGASKGQLQQRRPSIEVPTYPSPPKTSPAPEATSIVSHPVRSVTISEGHHHTKREPRSQRVIADEDSHSPEGRLSQQQPRPDSRARRSVDVRNRRSASIARRSLSLSRASKGEHTFPDPLKEPRRSIGKRPQEFDLRARDPHSGAGDRAKEKQIRREVPFAAPYTKSGVVLSSPATWSDFKVPGPLTLGHGQWWYLIAGQSIVAAVISGGINFGVGVATYNSYTPPTVVKLWQWIPVPLAGDMGVTVIVQQIVSMLITSALVHHDLIDGPIAPLRRPWPPLLHLPSTPSPTGSWLGCKLSSEVAAEKPLYMGKAEGQGKFKGYWWWFVRASLTGSERNDLLAKGISWRQRCERILWTAVQGFILCLLTFPWFWPLSIAIVAPIYQDRNLAGTWIPAIIKLVYGGVMALLTNPFMALLAMGAESSVRRAYPELDIWQAFGGQEDYQAWLTEQNLTSDDVEVGPNGLARSSTQIGRDARRSGGLESENYGLDQDTIDGREYTSRRSRDRSVGPPLNRGGLAGGTVISAQITEERAFSSPQKAEVQSRNEASPAPEPGPSPSIMAESANSFVSAA